MRYKVGEKCIRSHNAALSPTRPNPLVLDWIRRLAPDFAAVDYGCGRLRHFLPLASRVSRVVGIDSREQLERQITLFDQRVSVCEYVRNSVRNGRVYPLEGLAWRRLRFDVGLCTNVLSAIPCSVSRQHVLLGLKSVLRLGSRALITTHYNSDKFDAFASRPGARRHMDGYLIDTCRGTHFYGVIRPPALKRACNSVGFRVVQDLSTSRWACMVCEA